MKYGLPKVPLQVIVQRVTWTPEQAALFSIGLAPEPYCRDDDGLVGAMIGGDVRAFKANVAIRIDLFKGRSTEPMPPKSWLAWCRSTGHTFDDDLVLAVEGVPVAKRQTAEDRQRERWQMCVDDGVKMPTDTYGGYGRGLTRVAKMLGIKRQTLTEDLDAHRNRIFNT